MGCPEWSNSNRKTMETQRVPSAIKWHKIHDYTTVKNHPDAETDRNDGEEPKRQRKN